ncbi:MAG: glycosyltransferase family 4 protein [Acidobacteriia bacterium]|nr:glycosyltransferase family 4 protein [Terriglobia bacterium]
MKILLVHNRYQIHGGEEVVFEQERQLLERSGHQVLTYCRSNFEAEDYGGLRRLALIKNIAWSSDTKDQLRCLLREHQPDVVHVHNTFMMMSPSVFAACREARVPVVQTLHNYRLFCPAANFVRDGKICEECSDHSLLRGIRYGCYRKSRPATATVALMMSVQRRRRAYPDQFIALTEFSRQKFIRAGIPAEKLCVKPNFVYPDPGERSGDGAHAVFAGRLSDEKGLDTLLDAWKQLPDGIPLSIVGDGPLLEQLRNRATGMGLSGITFHGRLPREKTLEIIKLARFLVAPSQCYENFPMGIAEAFSCGVPVICSRLGGMREIVENKRTGLHFTAGDAVDLARKVLWSWSNPEQMLEMGKAARREYEAKYTAEKNYPLLMTIYQRAVAAETAVAQADAEVGFSLSRG